MSDGHGRYQKLLAIRDEWRRNGMPVTPLGERSDMKITRHELEELLDGLNMDREDPIREKYGWTGGSTCLGITFDFASQWEELLVELTVWAAENKDAPFNVGDIKRMIQTARKDDMGNGVIVFWPYGGLTITG